ncbi:MAG: hypothetical protein C0507_03870 [Cyanobacteria bacterium PR.3.49]|nr:hypothetical protein [Cyanobacteria bacterium PR.3.49]
MKPLRLSQKILLLVFAPLAVELLILLLLNQTFKQFETELQQEVRGRNLIDSIHGIQTSITQGSDAIVRHMHLKDKNGLPDFWSNMSSGNQKLEALEKSLDGSEVSSSKEIKSIRQKINLTMQNTISFFQAIDQQNVQDAIYNGLVARKRTDLILTDLNNIVDREQAILNKRLKSSEEYRKHLKTLLLAGVLANVLLGMAVAIIATISINKRVKQLMSHSRQVAAGVPVTGFVSGKDELAELDAALRTAAKELANTVRKQRAIVDNAAEVICSIDSSLCFTEINEAVKLLWQYEPEMLVGRRIQSIVDEQMREETDRQFNQAKQTGSSFFENRILQPSGSLVEMEWSVRWVPEQETFFVVGHDVSERKELERFKREFVSIVSHDLRTPLSSLLIKLDLLQSNARGNLPPDANTVVVAAKKNVKQLIDLTNDLLSLEQLEAGKWKLKREKTSLRNILIDAVLCLQGICDERNIEVTLPEQDCAVFADANRILQVTVNILSNALKFAPEGRPIQITTVEEDALVEVRITDEGPGIPEKDQVIIFERFQQAQQHSSTVKGFGLGLSICSQIVHAHGGTIGVESKLGSGCTFWFKLPKS